MLRGETDQRPSLPALPPMRDKLPTLPCDLTDYAWAHTGPESWSADTVADDELCFEADSCVAGPLMLGVRMSDVPRVTVPEVDRPLLGLDPREGFVVALLDQCDSVEDLLDKAAMPESETLELLCELCARGIVALEAA